MSGQKEKAAHFFQAYGKVACVMVSLLISAISLSALISLSSPTYLRVSFLDIGQGDAIVIETPSGHMMLIDGGPNDQVLARLHDEMRSFDRTIDVMIATHGDADHITGLIPVLENYDVKTIIRSPVEVKTGIFEDLTSHMLAEGAHVHIGEKGDDINFGDGVVAHVLYPGKKVPLKTETNDASVSVLLTYGEHAFLFTGDLSATYESKLVGGALPKHITVYKAGHHGSKTSSGVPLLAYIRPEYSIISAGKDNKYGHPNPETIERLATYSKEILSTIDHGTVTFISDGKNVKTAFAK